MQNYRIVLAGLSRPNYDCIKKATIATAWEKKLLPLKLGYFPMHGIHLAAITLNLISLLDDDNDFDSLVQEAGFEGKIPKEMRLLVSDSPYVNLPQIDNDHPLLCAIEISETQELRASKNNKNVLNFSISATNATSSIILICLELAYANSGFPGFVRRCAGLSLREFLRRKVTHIQKTRPHDAHRIGLNNDAPYLPFGILAFDDIRNLDDQNGLGNLIEIWDEFLASVMATGDSKRIVNEYIKQLPRFGKQLPAKRVERLVDELPPGPYLFAIRIRSKLNSSTKTKNKLYSAFTSLKYFNLSSTDFGFIRADGDGLHNETLRNLRQLEDEGAVFLTRVVI